MGDPTPEVDNATFADMQALGYWLETAKMRSSLAGNLLAGPLLADLLQSLSRAQEAVDAGVQVRRLLALRMSGDCLSLCMCVWERGERNRGEGDGWSVGTRILHARHICA